jgi:hypothetical protein
MENRERRLFNKVGHGVPRARRALCAAVWTLALALPGGSFASGCDSNMAGEAALYQATVEVRGQSPVKRTITLRSTSQFMVFARERGVDITLEVLDSAGHVLGQGDSPIRRTGMQRVEWSGRADQSYYIVLLGKDHGDSNGVVELRVVDSRRAAGSACLDAQKLLAQADAAYAAGQVISGSLGWLPRRGGQTRSLGSLAAARSGAADGSVPPRYGSR